MGTKYEVQWKQRLKELKAYKQKHGDCLVPRNYEQNPKLGNWVHKQRVEYKKWLKGLKASITEERIDQLNEIDFVWEVGTERDDTVWKQRFHKLVKYKKKHGDCLVSQNYQHNATLANWVQTQRVQYKKWLNGESAWITQERIDQLNEIDFVWDELEEQWKQRLKELKTYKQKHGDCLVPYNYQHNATLANWVQTQRVQYQKWLKGVHAKITQDRIDQLNEIDFVWEVGKYQFQNKPNDTLWKQQFNKLVKYKKKHGDCLVPLRYEHNEHNVKLGYWVGRQRQFYKKWLNGVHSQLTQDRIDQLNEIDFVWDARFVSKNKDTKKSKQEGQIPSVNHHNVASTKTKPNRPRKRQIPSKERPRKKRRQQQSQDVRRELSPSERKERRRLVLRALYNYRNPVQPDEVISV